MKRGDSTKRRIAVALRRYVISGTPSKRYVRYFGCSASFLQEFLEAHFDDGMTWKGFGKQWKIGHVLATSYFDMKKEGDRRLCWHWGNLRPVSGEKARSSLSVEESLEVFHERMSLFEESSLLFGMYRKAESIRNEKPGLEENLRILMSVRLRALKSRYCVQNWTVGE